MAGIFQQRKILIKKHGYGMKSIQNIVGKYNGSHFEQFDEQENEFTISIMLMK